MPLSHPKYRPDIDGLRAIAVLSVIAFHAFPTWVKGGFIGVDVFFVISGFLISTIIFENLDKGTFSFSMFYARRVKRIFPALLLVLSTSYAFGWFALLADEYKQLGKHILSGALFLSNFILWSESGYFDNAAETKPLLHLWSLGIEEQFYILWPFLLWLAWQGRLNLITLTIVVAVISFTLNIHGVKQDTIATFYSPQTRFWELLSGSILAWLSLYKKGAFEKTTLAIDRCLAKAVYCDKTETNGKSLSNCISFLGLFLLALGFWKISKDSRFPGMWAVVPVLGAVLIILAGPNSWINRKLLSSKITIWFGLISYPLYLWHWPLLSYARIVESDIPSFNIRLTAVLLSIILAWLTYKFLERPIRLGTHTNIKVIALTLSMVMIGYIGYYTYSRNGLSHREIVRINALINSGFDGGDLGQMIKECGISDETIRKLFRKCVKDKRGHVRFALMGDSKAEALYKGLVRTSNEGGRWLFIGGNGPNGAPTPLLSSDPDPNRPLTNYAIEAINNNIDIEVVTLVAAIRAMFSLSDGVKGGNLATYDYSYLRKLSSSNRFDDVFKELNLVISKFSGNGKKVIILVDNPALPNPQDCIYRRTLLSSVRKVNQDCIVEVATFNKHIDLYRKLLIKIKSANPKAVDIVDPTDIYCDSASGHCEATKNGRLMYSYTDHISDYAAGLVGARLNNLLTTK